MEEMLTSSPGGRLQAVLSHDEATAGNVLNPLLRKKILLFYVTFTALESLWTSSRAWLPVAAITHDQLQKCRGGVSGATAAFLRQWSDSALGVPFAIGLQRRMVSVKLKIFISDLDSQRAAMAAKGSAALKPCCFCSNCIAQYAGDSCSDEGFRTVAEHDFDRFRQYDRQDLETCILGGLARVSTWPKCERDLRERVLGFNFDGHSLWACPVSRALLHVDMIQNDALHCYWSNGICNSEMMLLLEEAKRQLGVDLAALAEVCLAAKWRRATAERQGPSFLRRLFKDCLFGSAGFKGSASETIALAALLRWVADTHWCSIPSLRGAAQSFLQLCRVTDLLRGRRRGDAAWQDLAMEQSLHQKLFTEQYPGRSRPKHHCRLHLPQQYQRDRVACVCWGVEAAHKNYKAVFSSTLQHLLRDVRGGSDMSRHLLPRMLLRSMEMLTERPVLPQGFELQNAFAKREVEEATTMSNTRISSKCRLQMTDLAENDYVLHGKTWNQACKIHFFLERDGHLYFFVTSLQLIHQSDACKHFRITEHQQVLAYETLDNMHVPAWQTEDNCLVLFLP